MVKMAKRKKGCKYGKLKTPYKDAKGVKHICRQKRK